MKIKKPKITVTQAVRLLLQLIFLIFLPSLYFDALNGIRILFVAVIHGNFTAVHFTQLVEAIAIIPATLLLGRFFCGWMCAFGAFFDFLYLFFRKIFKIKFKINEKADAVLKYFKYVWLVFIIVAFWILGSGVFSTASPWDAFGMLVSFGKLPAFSYVVTNLTVGFTLFCLIGVGSVFIERFFCRYLCPLGAIFAIISKLRLTGIKKPTEKCGKCRICTNNCAMGISLYKSGRIKSGECINCMKCVEACPRKNISFTVSGEDLRPIVAGTVTAAAMTGIYYLGDLTSTGVQNLTTASTVSVSSTVDGMTTSQADTAASSAADAVSSSRTSSSAASSTAASSTAVSKATASSKSASGASTGKIYKDGTYQGSGTGFRGGTTTLSVTIKSDKITAINAVSYNDDQQFFDAAFSTVPGEIISAQSAQVDAVSGATYSSNGIMEAVANALAKAKT